MFLNAWNSRFQRNMWSDSRLVDKAPVFCLCLKCSKEQGGTENDCSIHQRFMEGTRWLGVAAPIFACEEFEEDMNRSNQIDQLYEPTQEAIEDYRNIKAYKFAKDWEEQKKRWGLSEDSFSGSDL